MDANYEWQRQYANQRVNARRREADSYRAAHQASANQPRSSFFIIAILRSIGQALTALSPERPQNPIGSETVRTVDRAA